MKQIVGNNFPASSSNPLLNDDRMGQFWCKLLITSQFVQCLQVIHVALGIELMKQVAQPDPSPATHSVDDPLVRERSVREEGKALDNE